VAITGTARDTDLAGDHVPALGDAMAPTRVDVNAVQVEARIPGAAAVGGSGDAHWRRLLSLV
jgi:hypothetical protein